jgi:hypothetical protein
MGWISQVRASFFEKKEAKKLLVLRALATAGQGPAGPEVFLVTFFSKKVTSYFL